VDDTADASGAGPRPGDAAPPSHPNAVAVVEAARALGLDLEVARFPDGTRTAADAAAAVGCDVAQIVKSLVFVVGEGTGARPVLALVSGRNLLDEGLLAAAAGASHARRADAATVREATGFAIGGVPPLGHPEPLETYMDEDLLAHETVWAAAGTPKDNFSVSPTALARAVGATVVALRRA
jgi:prolyl-tRNA editing enzyme YbaK/EbsC (Cys-tRNA(Pro) deacylase)